MIISDVEERGRNQVREGYLGGHGEDVWGECNARF